MSCCSISRPVSSSALTHTEWNWTLIIIITVCLYFLPLLLFTVCFFFLSLPSSLPPSFPSCLFLSSFFSFFSFFSSFLYLSFYFLLFFTYNIFFYTFFLFLLPPSIPAFFVRTYILLFFLLSSFLPSLSPP